MRAAAATRPVAIGFRGDGGSEGTGCAQIDHGDMHSGHNGFASDRSVPLRRLANQHGQHGGHGNLVAAHVAQVEYVLQPHGLDTARVAEGRDLGRQPDMVMIDACCAPPLMGKEPRHIRPPTFPAPTGAPVVR